MLLIKGIQERGDRGNKPVVDSKSIAKKETSVMIEAEETVRPSIKIIREQYFFRTKICGLQK